MSKQTAVQTFFHEITNLVEIKPEDLGELLEKFEQAKAMEREQIEEAYAQGDEDYYKAERGLQSFDDSVDYYHQTYEKGDKG